MPTYIAIFLFELLAAYILWFVLKKAVKTTKLCRLTIICLIVSLAIGYIASYRIVGYQVTMDYLTAINDQRIEETGRGITLEEEDELKEELFQNKEYRELLANSSIKLSLFPFILVVFIMLFSASRGIRNLPPPKKADLVLRDEHGRTAADYDKLIDLDPDNADAYYNRGDAYDEMGEYGKAIADYNKAIQLNPNLASAYYNRGCAYGEIGAYDKAIADYNKAIELNPNDSLAFYNRGLAYSKRGEVPKAVSDLEKCIGLSTDPELTKDAQQTLSEIKKSP